MLVKEAFDAELAITQGQSFIKQDLADVKFRDLESCIGKPVYSLPEKICVSTDF